ncbi:urease accessory protein UreD [Dactylosporangium sp. NPDC051541]|uniref:urease accessory protein UreD n=1 Tax=Dactylosporangium sp. NPDC051541 TaxID=3363977 RepID=UPI0037B57B5A
MKAAARIVAELSGGRTVLRVLKGEAPLLPRLTGPGEVHLVGGAAGPLGGDDLSLEIEVGPGARLRVGTVAASIALPARSGAESTLSVHAVVGEAASLTYLPEPIVAAARCRHHNLSIVDLAADGALLWREEVVFGRFAEASGNIRLSTTARRAGRPWYRSDVTVGADPSALSGPATLAGARVLASLLTTAPAEPFATPTAAVMPLAAGGAVATVLGCDLEPTRTVTDRLIAAAAW